MNSNEIAPLKAEIIDRGRGPEIKGTRVTVYAVLDYVLECWHPARIAAWLNLSSDQVEAARTYLRDNTLEVLKGYIKILERAARGNPPALQAKIDAGQERFQELMKQIKEARARGAPEIQALIQRHCGDQTEECTGARNHGGE